MGSIDRNRLKTDVLKVLCEFRDDWDYSDEITESTCVFRDLGFESIDLVAFGSAIEDHYNQSLPFAEFLMNATERRVQDISIGDLLDFLGPHVRSNARGEDA